MDPMAGGVLYHHQGETPLKTYSKAQEHRRQRQVVKARRNEVYRHRPRLLSPKSEPAPAPKYAINIIDKSPESARPEKAPSTLGRITGFMAKTFGLKSQRR